MMGLLVSLEKNLSYIPLPKPIRLESVSTPTTGTIATSTFSMFNNVVFGSLTPKFPWVRGSLYGTILKLSSTIKGT